MVIITPTNFIMISFRLISSLPIGLSSPPQADTQKPKIMEKIIRGSILDLVHSSGKSDTVREVTISSAALFASPTSVLVISMVVPAEGLKMFTQISTQTEAMAPVKMKVPMVPPRIRPSRFMLAMLPTAEAMDTNTKGTTMVNSKFRKISPMGLMAVPTEGARAPMRAPTRMPPKIRIRLPYCCQKVFCFMMSDDADMLITPPFRSPYAYRASTAAFSWAMAFSRVARGQAAFKRI